MTDDPELFPIRLVSARYLSWIPDYTHDKITVGTPAYTTAVSWPEEA